MFRRIAVLFALLLLLAPVFSSGAPPASAASTQPTGAFGLQSRQGGEIAGLRTRTSKTVQQDGHFVTTVYPYSINYKDTSGAWQPIDNTLSSANASGFAYGNRANRYALHLPSSLSNGPVHVGTNAGWVEFSLVGGSGTGTVSGNTDTFSLSNGDLSLTAGNDAVKESIVLNNASAPSSYTYNLTTSAGLTAVQNGQGGIDFVNSAGQPQFSFAPPSMADSAGATSTNITMKLGVGQSGQTVTVAADPAWLNDPSRAYPVTIDPTVTLSGNTSTNDDCWIESGTLAGTNQCTSGVFKVGFDGTNDYRALLKFDLSSIPTNAQVLNAELGLRLYARSTTTGIPLGIYPATRSWTASSTWNAADGTSAWTTPGGDFTGTSGYTNTSVGSCLSALCDWNTWYPTALVQTWVNGTTTNNGFILKEPTESTTNVLQMYSSKSISTPWWPYLTVTYNLGIGEQSFNTFAGQQQLNDHMDIGVNPADGNLLVHEADLSMPGDGLPLSVGRYYNNLSGARSDLGNGWLFGTATDTGLQIFNDGSAAFTGPSGYQIPFIKNADGSFTAPTGIDSTLVKNGDGTYTTTDVFSGLKENFASGGHLSSEVDVHGNKLSFSYSGNWVTSITDTQGKTTTFTRNSGSTAIVQMTDAAGRTYHYAYDASLNLTGYTDPAGKVTSFTYDSSGNLIKITDPDGNQTRFTYDGSRRVLSIIRVTNVSAGTGPTTTFSYSAGSTVVTDPDGTATTYASDAENRITSVTDPAGNTTQMGWTPDSHVAQVTDPSGHVSSNSYSTLNSIDRLMSSTSPAGATQSYQYGNSNLPYRPTSVTNAEGKTATISYNSDGTVAGLTDPLSNSSTFTYNPDGTVASATPANGNASSSPSSYATKYSWSTGFLTGEAPPSPLGARSFTYNSYGLLATSKDGKGQLTSYSYDPLGRVTGATYADSSTVGYATDPDGNVTAMTDNSGTYTYSYDSLNQLTQKTYPNGDTYTYGYDPAGNLTSQQGPCNANVPSSPCTQTQYTYTDTGQVAAYQVIADCSTCGGQTKASANYQYDKSGEVTQVQLGDGLTEHYTYDADGNITTITVSDSTGKIILSENYSFTDPATGQQTDSVQTYTDSEGYTHTQTYDAAGHLIKDVATNPTLGITNTYVYTYDANGNLLSETINGSVIAQMNYNTADELTGKGTGTTCSSDANGNQTSCTDGSSTTYNASNNPSSVTTPGNGPTNLGFSGNNPSDPSNVGGNQTESSQAQLAYQLLQNGSTETFQSLPDGTFVTMVTSTGQTYYFLEDANGNIIAMFDQNGTIVDQCSYDVTGKANCSGSVSSPVGFQGGISLPAGLTLVQGAIVDSNAGGAVTNPMGGPACEGVIGVGCAGGAGGMISGSLEWCAIVGCPADKKPWKFKNVDIRDQKYREHKKDFGRAGFPTPKDGKEYQDWAGELLDTAIGGDVFGYDWPTRRARCKNFDNGNILFAVGDPSRRMIVTFFPVLQRDCEEYIQDN